MKTLKSLTALSLGALCLAFNTQVIAKEATPAKTTQATQQVTKASDNIDKYLAINIGNREMVVDENGQALSAFKHESLTLVKNQSKIFKLGGRICE